MSGTTSKSLWQIVGEHSVNSRGRSVTSGGSVHNNYAMRDGGGIYSNVDSVDGEKAALTLLDSIISDNVADRDGAFGESFR